MFFFWQKYLQNSITQDVLYIKKAYNISRLNYLTILIRPDFKNIDNFFEQYVTLLVLFSQGLIKSVYAQKRIYKDKEFEVELNFLGFKSIINLKKNKKNILSYFFILKFIEKFLISHSKIKNKWSIRKRKNQGLIYNSFTFLLFFSLEQENKWFKRFLSLNYFNIFLSFSFSKSNIIENIWSLSFFHFPFSFFFKKKKKLKKKK
jgi:hypothetical protein